MIRPAPATSDAANPTPSPRVPAWAMPGGLAVDTADAAFMAGAALNSLDVLAHNDPAFGGAWRHRLALKCAVSACRLAGRREDEVALRDAWVLRPPGGALGPGGSLLAAWRMLALPAPTLEPANVTTLAELLGLARDEALDEIAAAVLGICSRAAKRPAPFTVAAAAAQVMALRPDAELLAWWMADWVLAHKMRWSRPVPLFMAPPFSPAFRSDAGREAGVRGARTRIRPGNENEFERALCLGLVQGAAEACRMADEIARRAARLLEVAPKLRAKGAPDAIRLLLEEDAVPSALATKNLSRFASRRLFERLGGLGAVRELSGRASFRLYGL